ncbi:DMT family transporter [Marinilabiliaceae bacterium JC017]|nr:DMT family transporter [Marinilabiliaceae bacterium JC017]
MNDLLKNHIKLHFVVLIYGFTAILGKLINLPAAEMVLIRMFIAFTSLGVYMFFKKIPLITHPQTVFRLLGVGIIVALHWITFFHAIKISNVSVTLGCLASTTLFTSLMEPIIMKRRFKSLEIIIGLVIIIGLYLIFQFEMDYKTGIITALASAFLAGLFTVLNKVFITKHNPVTISFYEMGSGFMGITLFFIFGGDAMNTLHIPSLTDWLWLLLLGIVCTAYAFVVAVDVMKILSAYAVVLTINMEPVYGILLAYFIFGSTEFMSGGFYIGTLVILSAVFLHPVLQRKLTNTKIQ